MRMDALAVMREGDVRFGQQGRKGVANIASCWMRVIVTRIYYCELSSQRPSQQAALL